MTQPTNVSPWDFIDNNGTFVLKNPHLTSYLYFPLVNEAHMMSSVSPMLHGDVKTDQNTFLMAPVSVEDLHNSRSARNFWVSIENKGVWSATGNSARQIVDAGANGHGEQVELSAGLLWHKITRENRHLGLRAEITNFIPHGPHPVELMKVRLTNTSSQPITLTPTAAIPIYGRSADNLRDHRHVTSLLHRVMVHENGVLVCPTLSFDERGHTLNSILYGVFGVEGNGGAPVEIFPILEDFIGEGGTLDWPQAVVENLETAYRVGQQIDGYEAMGGLRFQTITLAPKQSADYVLILAIMREDAVDTLLRTYGSARQFETELEQTSAHWQAKAGMLGFQTGDPSFDNWLKWVTIQPVLRRLFGNSFLPYHDYGRGGRGWRDLWQDCLALLLTEPGEVPDLLFSSYAGVRIDGSNATIIGAKPGEFIADRNNIPRVWMDHGAWPLLTTRLYIDMSGDLGFLLRDQVYFKDPQISRSQAKDEQWAPEQGTLLHTGSGETYQGSILEHILVQHLTSFFHVGEHNIIKLEGADWNDGLDMAKNRGESVAFTALYGSNLRDLGQLVSELKRLDVMEVQLAAELLPLLDTLNAPVNYNSVADKLKRLNNYFATCGYTVSGKKVSVKIDDLAKDLTAKADWIFDHLRRQEWIKNKAGLAWFNGYYDDDGERVEGDHANGVRMTLTGQVFAVMGGVATDEQVKDIIHAVDRYLLEPSMGGYRLNTDFGGIQLNLGRCFGFAFGHKENGAMFSHMAVMYANALYRRGKAHEGYKVLDGIYEHCHNFCASRIYPGIPEYINGRGRGMYTYLTGSASWLLLTLVVEAFGVKGLLGDLALEPRLVSEQFDENGQAAIQTLFAGKVLTITYHNPNHLDYGSYGIDGVSVDGRSVPFARAEDTAVISRDTLAALDGNAHQIDVTLGAK